MIVRRFGQIFMANSDTLPAGCVSHAQSPQALVLEDGVRIYFSTRKRDTTGKFLSFIAFAEFENDMRTVRHVSRDVVLEPGGLGCFDEHGIFPMNVLRVDREVWGYTTGWSRRASVSVETGIGLVISQDEGQTFQRVGNGPVMGASLQEPFLVGDAFVVRERDQFVMWYMFGREWVRPTPDAEADRVYKIGRATSLDGVDWTSGGGGAILPDRLGPTECQALPTVLRRNGMYHMVFCYRAVHGFRTDPGKSYKLGYARSEDGLEWTRCDECLQVAGASGEWDGDMQCYPHLFEAHGKTWLLYNGNGFGRDGFGLCELDW